MEHDAQSDWIEATPDGSVLFAICESSLQWKEALGELIDNSFDAGAREVIIEFGQQKNGRASYLAINDDGQGCANPVSMIRLGAHEKQKTTRLGRYGIGAKDSFLWIGGRDSRVEIATTRGPDRSLLSVVWAELAKAWKFPKSALTTVKAGPLDTGTRIVVKPVAKRVPDGAAWKCLLDDLAYIYSPALKRNRRIVVRSKNKGSDPVALEPYTRPEMTEKLETQISVNGKCARIYAGIVKAGVTHKRPGITYTHEFRVIKTNSGSGCGGRDFSRIAGIVALDDSWKLTKNKSDVSEYAEELYDAVFVALKPLLERAESMGQDLRMASLTSAAEGILNGILLGDPDAKAKRKNGESEGAAKPTGKGSKHRRAAEEQDGATFARNRYGSLRIRYQNYGDVLTMGEHRSGIVFLSEGHPWVSRLRFGQNSEGIAQLALTLFLDDVRRENQRGQRMLPWMSESDLGKALGAAFGKPVELDGRALLEAAE